eukprot:scaffold181012_cov40-Tisochrysis_lutea.AAC.2
MILLFPRREKSSSIFKRQRRRGLHRARGAFRGIGALARRGSLRDLAAGRMARMKVVDPPKHGKRTGGPAAAGRCLKF